MTTKPTTGQAVHGGGQPMGPGGQPINPAGQPMNAPGQPMNPGGMPAYPRNPAPGGAGGRFKRFLFNVFLVIVAFAAGYLFMERESEDARSAMEREQQAAEDRIAALEQRIDELSRNSGTRVELDLTEVFEPIREALSQVTLVKLSEISEQITTELVRVVESDLAVDLAGVGAAMREEVAELAADEPAAGEGESAAESPAPEQAPAERAEAPAAEPSTQLPPEPGDEGDLAGAAPAAPEGPPASEVSWNRAQPGAAPETDLVLLLAQYEQAEASAAQ